MTLRRSLTLTLTLIAACRTTSRSPPPVADVPLPADASAAWSREITFVSDGHRLRGTLLRPAGAGPFPALVYNHGSERDPSLAYLSETGQFFQSRGWVVFFPFRRGSGGSEGTYWRDRVEGIVAAGGERDQAGIESIELENADVVAAIDHLRQQPFVDGRRVVVAGCSFGGIQTLLTVEKPLDLLAGVDFAGAAMSWAHSARLQQRLRAAARAATAPIFLVQAANDYNTAPSVELDKELTAAGKPHRMKIFPAHGTTPMQGHAHFCNHGSAEWGPDVLSFLADQTR